MTKSGRRTLLAHIVLVYLVILVSPGRSAAGEITGSVTTGFDSFTEKYSVVEKDTLDKLTEFRTRFALGYRQGEYLRNYFRIEGESLMGGESLESTARLALMKRWNKSRGSANSSITYRTYRDNSDYSFPNDFLRYSLRSYVQRDLTNDLTLRATDRLEILDFERRTEFDYDYVRNNIELAAELEHDLTTTYSFRTGFTHKSIPDTTEISYNGWLAAAEYQSTRGPHRQIQISLSGERRIYENEAIKSPFWSMFSNGSIHPLTFGKFGIGLDNVFEGYFYDEDTGTFFDYIENRSAVIASYFRSQNLTLGVGPTFGVFASNSSREDEYNEWGGKLRVDYNSADRVWLSASYEPGWRTYTVDAADDADGFFSDFVYNRILLFATVKLWKKASLNLFVNHEPENHKVEDDDTTATLFSLDLSYSI